MHLRLLTAAAGLCWACVLADPPRRTTPPWCRHSRVTDGRPAQRRGASCGARSFVTVDYWASRKGGGKPISVATEEVDDQTSGVAHDDRAAGRPPVRDRDHGLLPAGPGCGTGPAAHSVSVTSAPTGEVIVPPWLQQVSVIKGNSSSSPSSAARTPCP